MPAQNHTAHAVPHDVRTSGDGAALGTLSHPVVSPTPSPLPAPGRRRRSTLPQKAPGADLRPQYGLTIELGLVAALALVIALLRLPLYSAGTFEVVTAEQEVVRMEEIQQTKQEVKPPPPPRPPVPVEVPNDQILEEDFVLDATLDIREPLAELPPPPAPPALVEEEPAAEEEAEVFVVVEEMPVLIGGLESLHKHLRYPDLARRAGVEGRVIVQFIVDEAGNVRDPVVVRGAGGGLDEAALEAIALVRFTPGRQRGRPVKVKRSMPVTFRLR